jgi:Holliday junction resolvase
MPINNRRKGKDGENELARKLREFGFDVHRSQQYCGKTGEAADLVGLPGVHIECKRVEQLNIDKAMEQAINDAEMAEKKEMPAVFHRKNGKPWKVTILLPDFMKLISSRREYYRLVEKLELDELELDELELDELELDEVGE